MRHARLSFSLFICSAAFGCWGQEHAKPDNTKVNERDRNGAQATADKQKMNAADTELTRKIRRSIVADKSLSMYAHNVKIISRDGVVTLKGPVKSESEKKVIVDKAIAITGKAGTVTDQISVAK